ncbi:glycosyltransferase [Paenibacillus sp. FSL R10-2771]|uniref:glycosyltransferase n=1 Tax=Paenibacillus sp. FSL R10-2771 TaxID=2954693 RepID=UPI0030F6308D
MCFVILHYITLEDTKKCIDSIIEKIDVEEYRIVVVDNASPNDSGILLKDMYLDNSKIEVLIQNRNLGFAKGNNIGFSYAKKVFNSKFIVLLNNDTYLLQNNFYRIICDEYEENDFAVLGPRVYTPDGSIVNPARIQLMTLNELQEWEAFLKRHLFFNKIYLETLFMYVSKICRTFIRFILDRGLKDKKEAIDILEKKENVQLHGCCLVFSERYYEKFDGLEDRTFLYGEEDILFARLLLNGLKSVYSPYLEIYHSEDASTNAVFAKKRLKRRFLYEKKLESMKIMEEYISEVYRESK